MTSGDKQTKESAAPSLASSTTMPHSLSGCNCTALIRYQQWDPWGLDFSLIFYAWAWKRNRWPQSTRICCDDWSGASIVPVSSEVFSWLGWSPSLTIVQCPQTLILAMQWQQRSGGKKHAKHGPPSSHIAPSSPAHSNIVKGMASNLINADDCVTWIETRTYEYDEYEQIDNHRLSKVLHASGLSCQSSCRNLTRTNQDTSVNPEPNKCERFLRTCPWKPMDPACSVGCYTQDLEPFHTSELWIHAVKCTRTAQIPTCCLLLSRLRREEITQGIVSKEIWHLAPRNQEVDPFSHLPSCCEDSAWHIPVFQARHRSKLEQMLQGCLLQCQRQNETCIQMVSWRNTQTKVRKCQHSSRQSSLQSVTRPQCPLGVSHLQSCTHQATQSFITSPALSYTNWQRKVVNWMIDHWWSLMIIDDHWWWLINHDKPSLLLLPHYRWGSTATFGPWSPCLGQQTCCDAHRGWQRCCANSLHSGCVLNRATFSKGW